MLCGTWPARSRRSKNSVKPGEVGVRQPVVEAREIGQTCRIRDARGLGRLRGERRRGVAIAPVARRDQARVDAERIAHRRRPPRDPYGKDERQAGPLLPFQAQVIREGIAHAEQRRSRGTSAASPMTNRASCVLFPESCDIAHFGVARHEPGPRVPHVAKQEVQQPRHSSSSCGSPAPARRSARAPAGSQTASHSGPGRRTRSRDRAAADTALRRARTRRPIPRSHRGHPRSCRRLSVVGTPSTTDRVEPHDARDRPRRRRDSS